MLPNAETFEGAAASRGLEGARFSSFSVAEPPLPRHVKAAAVDGKKGVGWWPLLVRSTGRGRGPVARPGRNRLSGARSGGGLKVEGASSAADQSAFREDGWKAALKAGHAQVWQAEAG
jgi:hypothetical protein